VCNAAEPVALRAPSTEFYSFFLRLFRITLTADYFCHAQQISLRITSPQGIFTLLIQSKPALPRAVSFYFETLALRPSLLLAEYRCLAERIISIALHFTLSSTIVLSTSSSDLHSSTHHHLRITTTAQGAPERYILLFSA
jgi:hypothetical protein